MPKAKDRDREPGILMRKLQAAHRAESWHCAMAPGLVEGASLDWPRRGGTSAPEHSDEWTSAKHSNAIRMLASSAKFNEVQATDTSSIGTSACADAKDSSWGLG